MSTGNMAANWRQANDVIAPGWVYRQNVTCHGSYDISVFGTARGYDVICLKPVGGHIAGRHHNASVLDAVRKMSQRSRSTQNCVAYGCKNVYDETARNAGITFHA